MCVCKCTQVDSTSPPNKNVHISSVYSLSLLCNESYDISGIANNEDHEIYDNKMTLIPQKTNLAHVWFYVEFPKILLKYQLT